MAHHGGRYHTMYMAYSQFFVNTDLLKKRRLVTAPWLCCNHISTPTCKVWTYSGVPGFPVAGSPPSTPNSRTSISGAPRPARRRRIAQAHVQHSTKQVHGLTAAQRCRPNAHDSKQPGTRRHQTPTDALGNSPQSSTTSPRVPRPDHGCSAAHPAPAPAPASAPASAPVSAPAPTPFLG